MRGEEDRVADDTDKEFSVRGSQCRRVILSGGIQELWSVGRIAPRDSRGDPDRRARYTTRARAFKERRILKDESLQHTRITTGQHGEITSSDLASDSRFLLFHRDR